MDKVIDKIKKIATDDEKKLYSYVADNAAQISAEIYECIVAGSNDGGIFFVYGPVSSGKTLMLVDLIEKLEKSERSFMAIQPDVDRADVVKDYLYSRAGVKKKIYSFSSKKELQKIFHESDVVIIDEVNFIPHELQIYFLKEVMDFVERGGYVIVSGMLYTSQGGEFLLAAISHDRSIKSFEMTATCQKCGRRGATLNQRLVDGRPTEIDDPDLYAPSERVVYEPRCVDCHVMIG